MTEKVRQQVLQIRASGATNMFLIPMVQRLAYDQGMYELAFYLGEEKGRKEYVHFIFTGEYEAEIDDCDAEEDDCDAEADDAEEE